MSGHVGHTPVTPDAIAKQNPNQTHCDNLRALGIQCTNATPIQQPQLCHSRMLAGCRLLAGADKGLRLCWLCPVKLALEWQEADLDLAERGWRRCGDTTWRSCAALAAQGLAGTEAKDCDQPALPSDGLYTEAHLVRSCDVGCEGGAAESDLGDPVEWPLGSRGRLPVTSDMSWSMSKTAAISCQLSAASLRLA